MSHIPTGPPPGKFFANPPTWAITGAVFLGAAMTGCCLFGAAVIAVWLGLG